MNRARIPLLLLCFVCACGSPSAKDGKGTVVINNAQTTSNNAQTTVNNTQNGTTAGTTSDTTGGSCVDEDGDGFGDGCSAGEDCDDSDAACTEDCSDRGANGLPDCAEGVGEAVLLYWGSSGGGPDHVPEDPAGVYRGAGISVTVSETVPANLADDYGVLVLLNPLAPMPPSVGVAARDLVSRGGRLVSVVDHSGYGGHEQAGEVLAAVGSTMRSVPETYPGQLVLTLADVPELSEGVSTILPFYSARIEIGSGIAFGQTEDGWIAIGYEEVGRGDVLIVGDASMFGYALGDGDNAAFIRNFANLRR